MNKISEIKWKEWPPRELVLIMCALRYAISNQLNYAVLLRYAGLSLRTLPASSQRRLCANVCTCWLLQGCAPDLNRNVMSSRL